MRISIELVPRDKELLASQLQLIKQEFPTVNTINIPDVLRLDVRSWEGCGYAKRFYDRTIPHIRAMDIDLKQPLPLSDFLQKHRIDEVLVVSGDAPQQMDKLIYPTTSLEIIRKFKTELPHIKVYAAIDPYRSSIREEFTYIQKKLEAGADGFFTQPFFDLRLMEVYAEFLKDNEVFWGVSPVLSEKSHNYWETKNNAVFPQHFEPTFEWNVDFAKRALQFVKERNANIYLMPIKVDLSLYLQGIFV